MNTHPGVSLLQRVQGGAYNIRFFHPMFASKQILKSTKTDNFDIATRIAEEIHRLIKHREFWDNPPETSHPRTLELWGVKPLSQRVKEAQERVEEENDPDLLIKLLESNPNTLQAMQANFGHLKDWRSAMKSAVQEKQRQSDEATRLLESVTRLTQERDEWRERAVIAENQLKKMGIRAMKSHSALNMPLEEALATWTKRIRALNLDDDYKNDMCWAAERFVQEFKPKTVLSSMTGREKEIDDWIRSIKTKRKRGEKLVEVGIGAGRRREIRRTVLKFLTDSGLDMNRKAISRPSTTDVRTDRGEIRWLSKQQAKDVAEKLDAFWKDAFRIQVGLGLRPDELPTLKRADFKDNLKLLTLSELDHLTLKEGSRTVKVPETVREIIKRRLEEHDILFPEENGKPFRSAKYFDSRYRAKLDAAGKAAKIPFKLDCRIGRRTCATILLAAGVPVKTVADILGDDPAIVLEHYGAVIPDSLDPSAAAI